MTYDNIVAIVQLPTTFFEYINRDGIAVFDNLAKMMFPPFEETPENVAQNSIFYATSSISHHCPINNRINVFRHSFRLWYV